MISTDWLTVVMIIVLVMMPKWWGLKKKAQNKCEVTLMMGNADNLQNTGHYSDLKCNSVKL